MIKGKRIEKLLRQMFEDGKKWYYFNGERHEGLSFILVDNVSTEDMRLIRYAIEGEIPVHQLRHTFTGEFTVRPGKNRVVSVTRRRMQADWGEELADLNLFEVRLQWDKVPGYLLTKYEQRYHKTKSILAIARL